MNSPDKAKTKDANVHPIIRAGDLRISSGRQRSGGCGDRSTSDELAAIEEIIGVHSRSVAIAMRIESNSENRFRLV